MWKRKRVEWAEKLSARWCASSYLFSHFYFLVNKYVFQTLANTLQGERCDGRSLIKKKMPQP